MKRLVVILAMFVVPVVSWAQSPGVGLDGLPSANALSGSELLFGYQAGSGGSGSTICARGWCPVSITPAQLKTYIGAGSGTVGSGTAGQIAGYASAGTSVAGQSLGGDCSIDSSFDITCTESDGVAIVTTTATQTLTNKTISGSSNTLTNLPAANLTGTASVNTTGTAANLSGTPALPNGTTATTQTTGDNTTKLATDAFVIANAGSSSSITPGTTTIVGATAPCLINNTTGTTMGCLTTSSATQADLAANTTFTMAGSSGCTPTTPAGGPFGGTFVLASGCNTGTATVVITFNGATGFSAPNSDWHCSVDDRTTQATGTWIPQWGASAVTATTATIPIPGAAGTTDTISFDCNWH